jgi:hypothetical protein
MTTQRRTTTTTKSTTKSATAPATKSATTATRTAEERAAGHTQYFGSPEAYARAIESKISSGQALSDPGAATAFAKANPGLFSSATLYALTGEGPGPAGDVPPMTTGSASARRWEDWPWSSSGYYGSPEEEAAWKSWWESGGQPPPGAIPYTSKTASLIGLLNAITRRQAERAAPVGGWSMPEFELPKVEVPPPPKVEAEPKHETIAPEEAPKAPEEHLPKGMSRAGAGGFMMEAPLAAVAPSVEDLLAQYEAVFGPQEGRAREYAREYLASPYFQRVLGGAVPMWMQADPLWRLYLHRLGLLRQAVERRLGEE